MRRAAHNLIKTTVDCVCGNELEHQSHDSAKQDTRPVRGDVYNESRNLTIEAADIKWHHCYMCVEEVFSVKMHTKP